MVAPVVLRQTFDRAVSLPMRERAAFLREACGDDEALRQEVERLLAAHDRKGSFFDTQPVVDDMPGQSSGVAPSTPFARGTRLGPYEIVSLLGAGGMGEVYRARDTRLRRDVALKILPASVSGDPASRARFEQEAHAAAALNHPNVLGVYDVGSDQGVFYIATELVNGETVARLLKRGRVPIRKLLDISIQIADGMACAHAAHIVHRDLKPANVMVATDGRVKILDFGLAKQRGRPEGGDETALIEHTKPGMIVGTVSYMSPEQARGQAADYRSDQFSFGVLLYEMATGKKAFDRIEWVQTMAAIISEEPPPIDVRLPPPLRWAIDRCLAKDPGGRYESSRDLFHELRILRDHLSEVSAETGEVGPLGPVRRRSPRMDHLRSRLSTHPAIGICDQDPDGASSAGLFVVSV